MAMMSEQEMRALINNEMTEGITSQTLNVSMRTLIDATHQSFAETMKAFEITAGRISVQEREGKKSSDEIERIYRVNTIGPTQLVRAAWSDLGRSASPRVVSVSSIASRDPFPGLGVYGGAKAALNLLAYAWTLEGESIGLKAFSVAPGGVETAMLRSIISEADLPTDRCRTPDGVAGVIVACLVGERDEDAGSTIFLPGPGEGELLRDPSM